jgi:hypothetical protein
VYFIHTSVVFKSYTRGIIFAFELLFFSFVAEKKGNGETQKKAKLLPLSRLDSHFE